MIPFGEAVMFKLPKVQRRAGDLEDRFEKGKWLGTTVRSGEHIVSIGGKSTDPEALFDTLRTSGGRQHLLKKSVGPR